MLLEQLFRHDVEFHRQLRGLQRIECGGDVPCIPLNEVVSSLPATTPLEFPPAPARASFVPAGFLPSGRGRSHVPGRLLWHRMGFPSGD
jgi:hypothetical protein